MARFDPSSLNEKVGNDFTESLSIPSLFSLETKQYIPALSSDWTVGQGLEDISNNKPFSREYSIPSFPPNPSHLDKITLSYYSEEYGGSTYYTVRSEINITTYTSHGDFFEWTSITSPHLLTSHYTNEVIKTLTFNYTPPPTNSNPNIVPYIPAPSLIVTGGKAIQASISSNVGYEAFLLPSLGSFISNVGSYKYINKEDPSFISEPFTELLTQPYLGIQLLSPLSTTPVSVTVTLRGKLLYSIPSPLPFKEEPDILLHPPTTPLTQRLLPPGRSDLPLLTFTSFTDKPIISNFYTRKNQEPSL